SGRVDTLPLVSAAPVDLTQGAIAATEQVRLPKGRQGWLAGQQSPTEPAIRKINTRGLVPSAATVVSTQHPVTPSSRPLRSTVPSFPSLSSSNIAAVHIRMYAILATLGLI